MSEFFSFEDIQRAGKVVPLKDVRAILARTEPVEEHILETDGSSRVEVKMPNEWNLGLKDLDDANLTTCSISFGGKTYKMSKRAILSLLGKIGLSDRYAFKSPGDLLEPQVNYWFKNLGVGDESSIKLLTKGDYAVAFMKTSHPVVSNLEILEQVRMFLGGNKEGTDLFIDPNVVNNFVETDFRVILPKVEFEVETERNGEPEIDKWHFGVHVSNSLTSYAAKPLTLSGFMMEQRTLTGILPEYSQVASFTRAGAFDEDDLRGWVQSTMGQIMAILPTEADLVKHMPSHRMNGKVGTLTADIFRSMKIHRKVQERAIENLTESGDMTSYGIMHALAKSVSGMSSKIPPKIINHVQKVSGTLPVRGEDVCDECGRLHLFD